jgi:hypothetical protein
MKKKILIMSILILILFTSWVKNSTKKIEDQIFNVNENIRSLKTEIEYVSLEYVYLSSPKNLTQYQLQYFEKDLIQVDITKIKKLTENNSKLSEEDLIKKLVNNE